MKYLDLLGRCCANSSQNVLSATYPDIFKAAIVYSGVNAGCFMSASGAVDAWNSTCANGQSISTPANWAKVAQNMYPSYTGSRPKMQIYHGSVDATLKPQNYQETMKQWAGVFGYNYDKPESQKQNDPQQSYTRTTYGPLLQGIYATGVGHSVPIRGSDDMKFFGFA
jgi:acetylxylan esterase